MSQLFSLIDYVRQKKGFKEPGDFEDLDAGYDSSISWYTDEEVQELQKAYKN
ncbi:MAG: hypothetical protein GF317_16020 [Candidatus Lokiarchaeota archaeon]|nr:hypothetical protein [Candidatus Lokiarchaeota archaeon]